MKKCFVAVSGGVDSAVALNLLKKEYSVEGITMVPFDSKLVPNASGAEAEDAKQLCNSIGVPHHKIDLSERFYKTVIKDFVDAYANGETPNPCIVCNRRIKFGALADVAFERGADFYATGHYVRVKNCGHRRVITRAADPDKDQSYMLWQLTQEQLLRFVAPLGEYTKAEVRRLAEELGLSVAHKGDSQDICFIPDGNYRAFLDRIAPSKDIAGDFVLTDGTVLGRHNGQRCYTIGQRKGLGIAYTEPLYVIGRDISKNQIVLGKNESLFTDSFIVREANFSACDYPEGDFECEVRIRYRAPFVKCRLTPLGDGKILVKTDEKVRAVTAGQSAVFYDGETLLGGGIICS